MSVGSSLNFDDLRQLGSAPGIHSIFPKLGYDVEDLYPYEGRDLDQFEFDRADRYSVNRAYIVGNRDRHTAYLFEVNDLRQTSLRGIAWNLLERGGTALLIATQDYREVVFADPRFVGTANKSNVRI